jgi:hypothetical protein
VATDSDQFAGLVLEVPAPEHFRLVLADHPDPIGDVGKFNVALATASEKDAKGQDGQGGESRDHWNLLKDGRAQLRRGDVSSTG